jgi:hypothetical protein
MQTDGSQWFAIFNAGTGDLVSTGNVVTFPLGTGLRAVTVDGPQNGRYWDKTTLNFLTTPPPPPTPVDPFPLLADGADAELVFTGKSSTSAVVNFSTKFTVPPRITGLVTSSSGGAPGASYLILQVGSVTATSCIIYAKAAAPLNYTQRITWSAEQRWKDRA